MPLQQPVTDDLAKQLREWRKQEKLTQAAAAAWIDISSSHLGNLEVGNKTASPELVMRIQKRIKALQSPQGE